MCGGPPVSGALKVILLHWSLVKSIASLSLAQKYALRRVPSSMPSHVGSTGASSQVVTGWIVAARASNTSARHAANGRKRRLQILGTWDEVNVVSILEIAGLEWKTTFRGALRQSHDER